MSVSTQVPHCSHCTLLQWAMENVVKNGWPAEQQLEWPEDPPALLAGLKQLPASRMMVR